MLLFHVQRYVDRHGCFFGRETIRPTDKSAPTTVGLPLAVNADADADTDPGIAGNGLCSPLETGFSFTLSTCSDPYLLCAFFSH